MWMRTSIALPLLVLVTACGEQAIQNETMVGTTNTAAPAPVAGPDAEQRFTQLAECSSTMKAVGNLYSSIASQQSGAEGEEMRQTATARTAAGVTFRDMAVALAPTLGKTAADVDQIIAATDAEIQQASQTMEFEQFATRAAREGDQCAPLLNGGS